MTSETYAFTDADKVAACKESLGMRHPSNRTEWLDDFTVKFEDPHYQVGVFVKGYGGKKVD